MGKGVVDHANPDNPNKSVARRFHVDGTGNGEASEATVLSKEIESALTEVGVSLTYDEVNSFVNFAAIIGSNTKGKVLELHHIMNEFVIEGNNKLSYEQVEALLLLFKKKVYQSRNALELYSESKNPHTSFGENVRTIDSSMRALQFIAMDIVRILVSEDDRPEEKKGEPRDLRELENAAKTIERISKSHQIMIDNLDKIRDRANMILLSNTLKDMATQVSQTPAQTARILSKMMQDNGVEAHTADEVAARFFYQ